MLPRTGQPLGPAMAASNPPAGLCNRGGNIAESRDHWSRKTWGPRPLVAAFTVCTFVHTALLWGLPVVGVPVLIHLINMLRHRRVRWAAMEFLLRSHKKNRTWVTLKQLLLLLYGGWPPWRWWCSWWPSRDWPASGAGCSRPLDPLRRPARRQFLDVRLLGPHQRLPAGQGGREPDRQGRGRRRPPAVHAAAFLPGERRRAPPSPTVGEGGGRRFRPAARRPGGPLGGVGDRGRARGGPKAVDELLLGSAAASDCVVTWSPISAPAIGTPPTPLRQTRRVEAGRTEGPPGRLRSTPPGPTWPSPS